MPVLIEEDFNVESDQYSEFLASHHGMITDTIGNFHRGKGVVGPARPAAEWRWSIIRVTNITGTTIEVVKCIESLWVYGYRRRLPNGEISPWRLVREYEKDNGFSGLPGEKISLDFDGKHPLVFRELNVGKNALDNAVTTLDEYARQPKPNQHVRAKAAFLVMVFYFAEALRLVPIRNLLTNGFRSFQPVAIDSSHMNLIRNWSKMSQSFINGENSGEDLWLVLCRPCSVNQLDGVRH